MMQPENSFSNGKLDEELELEAEAEDQAITMLGIENFECLFFQLCFQPLQCSFHWSHKWNQYFASDSVSLISTRSYRSALLITTPPPARLLVKTGLEIFR